VFNNDLKVFLSQCHELAAPTPHNIVDETLKSGSARDSQVARVANLIKARQHTDHESAKLIEEQRHRLHGVLLHGDWLEQHHCVGRTPILLLALSLRPKTELGGGTLEQDLFGAAL
jgi:hypothetical protein